VIRSIQWKIVLPISFLIFTGMIVLAFVQGGLTPVTIAVIITVVMLSAMMLALLVSEVVTSRMTQITRVARQIAAGKPARAIQVGANDEIGQLVRAFNEMSAELRKLIDIASDEKSTLAAVLNSITDSIIMIDTEGTIVLANPAAERNFNFNLSGAQGKRLIEVIQD
jgi:signal transduction histidine kinase